MSIGRLIHPFTILLVAALVTGCVARQAKVLSTDLVEGQQFHQKQDEIVYEKLLQFIESDLERLLEAKKAQLNAIQERYRARIHAEINQAYFDGLAAGFAQIDETTEGQLDGVTDARERHKIIGAAAVMKVKLVEEGNASRQQLIGKLLARLEEEASAAQAELESVQVNSQTLRTQVQEPLTIIKGHHEQLVLSQKQLDDYLQRKSEITLALGGFLRGLGINVDDGRIEERVGNVSSDLERRVNSILDRLNGRLEGALEGARSK